MPWPSHMLSRQQVMAKTLTMLRAGVVWCGVCVVCGVCVCRVWCVCRVCRKPSGLLTPSAKEAPAESMWAADPPAALPLQLPEVRMAPL